MNNVVFYRIISLFIYRTEKGRNILEGMLWKTPIKYKMEDV